MIDYLYNFAQLLSINLKKMQKLEIEIDDEPGHQH